MDEKDVLRVALDWEVDGIDPPRSFGGWNTGRVVQQTHESLMEDDFDTPPANPGQPTAIVPRLASQRARSTSCANAPGVGFDPIRRRLRQTGMIRARDRAAHRSRAVGHGRIGQPLLAEFAEALCFLDPALLPLLFDGRGPPLGDRPTGAMHSSRALASDIPSRAYLPR
ncbi:hypothetical protein [Paracoccus mutanolyticus]|uniref:hypothetical protein n=1 Tax=Paracoccus mutanolyticus TaxID=1499308 RepID=UPI001CB94712|nr:hypothetical protein [Paracoccus mutanolyticus]